MRFGASISTTSQKVDLGEKNLDGLGGLPPPLQEVNVVV